MVHDMMPEIDLDERGVAFEVVMQLSGQGSREVSGRHVIVEDKKSTVRRPGPEREKIKRNLCSLPTSYLTSGSEPH